MPESWEKINPGEPIPESINVCGLTLGEQRVINLLTETHKAFLELEPQHPDELREFIDAVHDIQGIMMERVVRRSYPNGWPAYRKEM